MIFAGCHIFDGKGQCRFFGESFNRKYRKAFCGNRLAHAFDVAEAGFRASWRNTKNHQEPARKRDRKSTRLNSSHQIISYAVFCLKKKKKKKKKRITKYKHAQTD